MISIIKYISETDTYDPSQQGPITGALKYWTGLRTGKDVEEGIRKNDTEHKFAMAKAMAKKNKETADYGNQWKSAYDKLKSGTAGEKSVSTASNDITGTDAAGVALKKGGEAAGDAVGSLGKKTMELAGEHPGMVLGGVGLTLGALLARRRKAQQQ